MSVFVDTSALYAVLDADDDEHSRAVAEWHRLVRGAFPFGYLKNNHPSRKAVRRSEETSGEKRQVEKF